MSKETEFDIQEGVLVKYTGSETVVTIPDTVNSVKDRAFAQNMSVTEVHIPHTVTKIHSSTFRDCKALVRVEIPNSVTYMGESVFNGCSSLEEITLSESMKMIYDTVFYQCGALKKIHIPEGITYIGTEAFGRCKSLTDITIPSTVAKVGVFAFKNCSSLEKVVIKNPDCVCVENAFQGTPWGDKQKNQEESKEIRDSSDESQVNQREVPQGLFKYHPNYDKIECVMYDAESEGTVCDCCGKHYETFYTAMYAVHDVEHLCVNCIASGEAAKKFEGTFVQDGDKVEDEEKNRELYQRTPGFSSWQGEYWRACCDDFCAFLGDIDVNDLKKRGALEEVLEEHNANTSFPIKAEELDNYSVYLFQCLHCKKYKIHTEFS